MLLTFPLCFFPGASFFSQRRGENIGNRYAGNEHVASSAGDDPPPSEIEEGIHGKAFVVIYQSCLEWFKAVDEAPNVDPAAAAGRFCMLTCLNECLWPGGSGGFLRVPISLILGEVGRMKTCTVNELCLM